MAAVLCGLSFFATPAHAEYGGGTGEPNDPYLIFDANQMNTIGIWTNLPDWEKHFRLMADIDLSGYTGTAYNIIPDFSGVFDGSGHTISNFSYTSTGTSNIGLFGYVDDPNAEIKNLGLIDPNLDAGTGDYVGSLVGYLSRGTITNCYAEAGSVAGRSVVGGLVGRNYYATITNCYSTVSVTGYQGVGGLVGQNRYGTITNCYSTGSVAGSEKVGGLMGRNGGTITNCYSTASVSGDWSVGGLVGLNLGTITNCYSIGSVSGSQHFGGLVGYNWEGEVTNCFWNIDTSGQSTSAGGTGKTTAEMQMESTFASAGWNFENIWWIFEGLGYPRLWWEEKYGGGSGTAEKPYLIYDANQMNALGADADNWDKHFKLMADIDLSGFTGTSFNIIGYRVSSSDNKPFTGVFDGNGHAILNFSFISTGRDYIGLFGHVSDPNAEIKDLRLIAPNVVAGTGDLAGSLVGWLRDGTITNCHAESGSVAGAANVGGLVGENWGTITNCHSAASISGVVSVGGLVGWNSSTITNCYACGSVSGTTGVGGLVGSNGGEISNCYSSGDVSGVYYVGGLVGENDDSVTNCYSTGSVSNGSRVGGLVGWNEAMISGSFWDKQTSGLSNMCGSQGSSGSGCDNHNGKPTVQMQRAGTFMDAGWDFVGEIINGTEDIWTICEGVDYPKLTWQFIIGDFDGDDDADFVDFAILAARWLQSDSSFWCGGGGTDLTNDGDVGFSDLKAFADNWLAGL
ncbi:hypothetical protein ES703_86049 [subsurface metagenome]